MKRVLKENSLGLNLEDTLVSLNNRVESEDWDLVTTVVLIQRQVGGNLAEVLEKIGHTSISDRISGKDKKRIHQRMGSLFISPFTKICKIFMLRKNIA